MMVIELAIQGTGVVTKFTVLRLPGHRNATQTREIYAWTAWHPQDPNHAHECILSGEVAHNPESGIEQLARLTLAAYQTQKFFKESAR